MKKKFILKFSLICLVVALDLFTKVIFKGKEFSIIPGVIGVDYLPYLNEGAAFSIFEGYTALLVIFSLIAIVFIFLFDWKYKPESNLYMVGICFVLGGAIGNLVDRILLGGVRDFIVFEFWPAFPTFNLADSFLVVGVILLVVYMLFFNKEKKSEK